jgi:hypothetical protein
MTAEIPPLFDVSNVDAKFAAHELVYYLKGIVVAINLLQKEIWKYGLTSRENPLCVRLHAYMRTAIGIARKLQAAFPGLTLAEIETYIALTEDFHEE